LLPPDDALGDEFEVEDGPDAEERAEAAYREHYEALVRQFYPQPGSVEWFQPFGLCHWLVEFQLGLARRAMPGLTTVVGRRPGARPHQIAMVLDLLREGEDAQETISDARRFNYRSGEYNQETGLVTPRG
jgi:hypothetical protein